MSGKAAIASRKPSLRSRAGGDPGRPLISTMSPLPFRSFADVLAGRAADLAVVGADERRVGVALDRAVEDDDRDAALEGPADDRRQRLRLVGRDHQQVDLLPQEVLDVGHLLGVVLLRVGEDDLDVADSPSRARRRRRSSRRATARRGCTARSRSGASGLRLAAGVPHSRGNDGGREGRRDGPRERRPAAAFASVGGACPARLTGAAAGARPRRG